MTANEPLASGVSYDILLCKWLFISLGDITRERRVLERISGRLGYMAIVCEEKEIMAKAMTSLEIAKWVVLFIPDPTRTEYWVDAISTAIQDTLNSETEACARVAENQNWSIGGSESIAKAIRNRKKKNE